MLHGVTGSLVSKYFAERLLLEQFHTELGDVSSQNAFNSFSQWWAERGSHLGPASSVRAVWENATLPLVALLGFDVPRSGELSANVMLLSGLWTDNLGSLWRQSVRTAIESGADWCVCTNGRELRLVDARRTYSRLYLQFDLEGAAAHRSTFTVLRALFRAGAFESSESKESLIARVVRASEHHATAVGKSLRFGVIDAVGELLDGLVAEREPRRKRSFNRRAVAAAFDESLTLVYRVLFLMFAEARGLVPTWHPVYREHYTIESLRDMVEQPQAARGLWEALQAIARLAHDGCRAGTLVVPAFNGRLFSPARSPLLETAEVDDRIVSRAISALSVRNVDRRSGRVRIDYRDLGVEQLGAVYESVLDYVPTDARPVRLVRGGDERKATGSFYTPQSITNYLVRRTLQPLVDTASPEEILRLRIVDPSMGSAAFLVAACRYLGAAYERALVRTGQRYGSDISESDRAGFRRMVAQRCLYGVDLNPTAVQLARLSLWLATLSAGKPLTFLDHHLLTGDSLLGASLEDVARQSPGGYLRVRHAGLQRHSAVSLFSDEDFEASLATFVHERQWLADTPDDSLGVVREKEERLSRLRVADRWRRLLDLWCACWIWPDAKTAPDRAIFSALSDSILGAASPMPRQTADRYFETLDAISREHVFFHWPLAFPELYFSGDGQPLDDPGFDAVIGNPPWDMLRADSGDAREDQRRNKAFLKRFFRDSGIYRLQGPGHINRYQLFVERASKLLKRGGRLGLVLPSGIMNDHTSATLRRHLIETHSIDAVIGFDNRRAIFPIHRSVRFVLLTSTSGSPSARIPCRFGIDNAEMLDSIPDSGCRNEDYPVTLSRPLIQRLSSDLVFPQLKTALDVRIVDRVSHHVPRVGDRDGWGARFGRELNATDDRRNFRTGGCGIPVLEGKHIEPFRVHTDRSRLRISEDVAEQLLDSADFRRSRLTYRDVASPTNRVSLIAAILPPGVITTHSLFCLKTSLTNREQHCLCGLLNSYVANYLVRQVMTTHLGAATMQDLRVPRPGTNSALFEEIAEFSRRLSFAWSLENETGLQRSAAQAYGIEADEFRHIIATFPLIPESHREACVNAFRSIDA